jgi:hypothetical protein
VSGHKEEKILIQIDTEPQHFDYEPEKVILNRFDVFTTIWSTPLPLLMAQKLYAIINRKRNKGRDFYDLVFLMGRDVKPDFIYLENKISISEPERLRVAVIAKCNQLDMNAMAKDVEPFLFDVRDIMKVEQFEDVVKQYSF